MDPTSHLETRSGRRRFGLIAAAALMLSASGVHAAQPLTLVYPRATSAADTRSDYALALLHLVFAHEGIGVRLRPSDDAMTQRRAIVQLSRGRDIDVIWSMTSREREKLLRAVPIPLAKGLAGWRVLLIREGDQRQFSHVNTLAALAALKGGQAKDWPDTRILMANGLDVYPAPSYQGLFPMLQYGHIDYFSRTVREARIELQAHPDSGLVMEQHLALHYPTAFYFFVAPNNKALAERIEAGLRAAIADGTFDRVFRQHFQPALDAAELNRRTVLELTNPVLPPDFPTDPALWYHPLSGR